MIHRQVEDNDRQPVLQSELNCALCFFLLVYLFCVCSNIDMRLTTMLQVHMAPKPNFIYFRDQVHVCGTIPPDDW